MEHRDINSIEYISFKQFKIKLFLVYIPISQVKQPVIFFKNNIQQKKKKNLAGYTRG